MSVNVNPIEALLGAPGAFPPMLDIPPDADDETMVELAIALSLQVSTLTVIIGYRVVVAAILIISYKENLEKVNNLYDSNCKYCKSEKALLLQVLNTHT